MTKFHGNGLNPLNIQATQREHRNQADLLLPGELEAFQNGHWQHQHRQIGDDVKCRETKPEGNEIDTVASFNALVREECNGLA